MELNLYPHTPSWLIQGQLSLTNQYLPLQPLIAVRCFTKMSSVTCLYYAYKCTRLVTLVILYKECTLSNELVLYVAQFSFFLHQPQTTSL